MPILLSPQDRSLWLDEEADREAVVKLLLTPALPHEVVAHPVSGLVNDANNEGSRVQGPARLGSRAGARPAAPVGRALRPLLRP